jgi:hypothetical protein
MMERSKVAVVRALRPRARRNVEDETNCNLQLCRVQNGAAVAENNAVEQ